MSTLLYTLQIVDWLEKHMLSCPSKKYLHIECFGCGFQRSAIALLKGDLKTSLQLYPATIPIFFMFTYTMLHLKFNFSNGASVIKYAQIGIAVLIVAFFIYKIISHKVYG